MAIFSFWSAALRSPRAISCAPTSVCTCAASRFWSCLVSWGSLWRLLKGVSYLMILLREHAPVPSTSVARIAAANTLRSIAQLLLRGSLDPAAEFRMPPRPVQHLALQLAAGGVYVVAAGAAHHRLHVRIQKDLLERADGGLVRTRILGAGEGIERNQVHLGRQPAHQLDELLRQCRRVVDALHQRVFEGDRGAWAPGGVARARVQQFGDGIFLVERHQLGAQL